MGFKKVSKLIEKINVLHDSLLSIDEEISSIEKDLLLNYIRQLYEQVLQMGAQEPRIYSEPIKVAKEVIDLPKKEEVVIQTSVEEISDIQTEDSLKMSSTVMPDYKEARPVSEVDNSTESQGERSEHIAETDVLDEPITMKGINEELVEMFEIKEARDVSEKLSSQPIKDLNTAMGINDRFLTVNELFGGDANAFKVCVDSINNMENYEEAKSYLLSDVAQKFDWSSAERLKKAAGFITLVQRRFR